MAKSAQIEFKTFFKSNCCILVFDGGVWNVAAHPSPRLWSQPCCQTSHWEGAAHRRSRRHPARLPYDRCKPSSIGRSPLHPRPATHGKSTSIQAREKSFKRSVSPNVSPNDWQAARFFMFLIQTETKQNFILDIETNVPHFVWLKGKENVFFFLEEECSLSSALESPSGVNEAQGMVPASLSVPNKIYSDLSSS